ncbi:ATP-dependent DNA helicase RecQ [Lutibacter oricola]|uniref:ATP-dependent DNA helicase RecQ n=1 Tax=Lutibacter oricola TaxID=762486 RepID=A0A1H2VRS5_9FLAO|nr:RecQ family ATP-dependent DNA helicase [Lutibacter oricola]SDW71010.1 ATP-dependent DNA helicase RecQ [Lutibacter oricola]
MSTPLEILEKYWGYTQFRDPQEEIINSVLNKKNTVVLLPTGGGKSLCFQVPALLLDGVCIVISPLIALINDQVKNLQEKQIKAIALTSQLNQEEIITAFDNLMYGNYKFLYLSPEKFQSPLIQEKIKQLNVGLIAIDEAHCISEWGHDFRPSYLLLKELKNLHPNAPLIALTATATPKVLNDIQDNLELTETKLFKKSFKRSNLGYYVIETEDIYGRLLQISKRINEPIIIYTNSRKQTIEISQYLNRNNFKSSYYHGGLTFEEKNTTFNNWMSETTPIMVATNAFGMGIDKANVRAVVHINTPNSIENYIQEAGRAGRDQKMAYAIALTNKASTDNGLAIFNNNLPTVKYVQKIYNHLNQYYNISLGELPTSIFNFSVQEFCSVYKLNILQTYNAIKALERENIISIDENFTKKSTLKIIISNNQLLNYLDQNSLNEQLLNFILRSYGGVFDHYTVINETYISKKLKISKSTVIQQLQLLDKDGIINYSYENSNSRLTFLVEREDKYTINRISKNIEQQNQLKKDKYVAVVDYLKNNKVCRNIQLLSYFNETLKKNCSLCDVCKSKTTKKVDLKEISHHIIKVLQNNSLSSREIAEQLTLNESDVLNSLKILLERNKITITSQNKFKLT